LPIARFAVTRRVTVAMIATAFVVLGIFAFPRLPIALLPNFQPPTVTVTVNYPNVAPETMEVSVTRPIENAVSRIAGIDILQSDSFQGSSQVTARFKFGVNIDLAAVQIQQQISRIRNQLPNDPNLQEPIIVKADPSSLPVVFMFVTDTNRTISDLGDLWTNDLSDEFAAIPGVATVGILGTAQRAIMVQPNSRLLAANGLNPDYLVSRISQENVDLPAGISKVGPREFQIRTNSLFKTATDAGNIVIAVRNGVPIYLHDVAKVSDSIEEMRIFTRLDGILGIRIAVTPQPDANVVSVANQVYQKMAEVKRRYPSMRMGIVLDQREFIQEAISSLEHTAIYGAILAVLIILLFLHSYRSTLIVAMTIPVSILGTLFAAYMFGFSLNTMTLGGIALSVGLIVDDAIVVIENIFRHMHAGESPRQAAESATAQILMAVLASTITVVTVFVPLLLIPGLQGLIFGPFALMVMSAVAISFCIALTTVPMLSSRMLRQRDEHENYAFARWFDARYARFEKWYTRRLSWALDHAGIVLGVGAASFLVALILMRLGAVHTEVFPQNNSRFARFDFTAPSGTALAVSNQISAAMKDAFMRDPRVLEVGEAVGTAFGGGTIRQLTNRGILSVTLRSGTSSAQAGDFVNTWQRRFGGAPGARRGATAAQQNPCSPEALSRAAAPQAPPGWFDQVKIFLHVEPPRTQRRVTAEDCARFARLRQLLIGVTVRGRTIDILQQQIAQGQDALQVQILGPDYKVLSQLANKVMPHLAQIPGVVRPDTNTTDNQPEIDIKLNRRVAAELGVTTQQIAQAIDTSTNGTIASYWQLNGQLYPILVQLPPNERRSFNNLATLPIWAPLASGTSGANPAFNANTTAPTAPSTATLASVPLGSVANLVFGLGPSQISRQNKVRRIDINSTVIGRPLGAVVDDAKEIMDAFPLPSGYRWQFGPAITQNQDTFTSLALVVLLAIALIYMLLASQFESYLHPLIIMTSVPLSIVGVVLSLWLTQRSFGLTAFIGTLMLVGIVVKNAILVVEFTNQLRHQGLSARDAIMRAAPMRLRPIIMTTTATIGGMLPLALAIEAGSETQAPLGTVVIGGLLTSTMLSLIVVPTLYLWVARNIEPRFEVKPPKMPIAHGEEAEPAPANV
jgi:HAE1 family hydrophobic/amphiphilic exporter-1